MGRERVVIVGGGIAGVALAWWLSRRADAPEVVLLEREPQLGAHSSGKNAAILRTAIESGATRALARETAEFLRRPPRGFAPRPLLDERGLLIAEGSPGTPAPRWTSALVSRGEALRVGARDLQRHAPHLRPAGRRLWWLPNQGEIDVASVLDGFARGARRAGAQLRLGTPVQGFLRQRGEIHGVRLRGGVELEARWTVCAAGGWAGRLAGTGPAADRLCVTRRHLLVSRPSHTVSPRWPIVWDDRAGLYARPESGGLLLCACDQERVDPDRLRANPDVLLSMAEKVARLLPGHADLQPASIWAGLRTLSSDDAPLIGHDPTQPGLFLMAGLGGHGMSICAAAGRVAAALLVGDELDSKLRAGLDPARFQTSTPEATRDTAHA